MNSRVGVVDIWGGILGCGVTVQWKGEYYGYKIWVLGLLGSEMCLVLSARRGGVEYLKPHEKGTCISGIEEEIHL